MKAFGVDDAYVESVDTGRAFQGQIQSASGVLAEHQVLPIGQGEGLFIGTLHGGLYGSAECRFGVIDECNQRQVIQVVVQPQL